MKKVQMDYILIELQTQDDHQLIIASIQVEDI